MDIHDQPLAAKGFTSYRYQGRFGWIMIGAKDHEDALKEARRSVDSAHVVTRDRLEVWDGKKYIRVIEES